MCYRIQQRTRQTSARNAMVKFSQDVFDTICARIMEGRSVRSVTSDEDMPSGVAFFSWLAKDETGELIKQYAKAKEAQADALADEILRIADDGTNDFMETDEGYRLNGENVQRSRLRIDARKWMAGKLRPKVYGEKFAIGGADDLPPVQTEENGIAKLAEYLNDIAKRS